MWVYGNLIRDFSNDPYGDPIDCVIYHEQDFWIVDPDTIGQFTGYKMWGEDLYFGDLVSNNYGTDKEVIRQVVLHQGIIALRRITGESKLPHLAPVYEYGHCNFKIIGNIHDEDCLKQCMHLWEYDPKGFCSGEKTGTCMKCEQVVKLTPLSLCT